MNQGYIDVTGSVLFYESCGSGEPVIFIHGNYNDHRIWEEQLGGLSGQHYVIGYDLRGYGQSGTPSKSFSHVEDLKLLMDTLSLPKVTLAGSSMGGSIAIDFALAYPDRVDRLILAAPSVSGRNYPVRMMWKGISQHFQLRLQGHERAVKAFITNPFWQYYFPAATKERAWQRTVANVKNPGNFCRFPPSLSKAPKPYAIRRLGELQQPVLIVVGELDHPFNKNTSEILYTGFKHSTKIVMQNCSHLPFIEEPELFNSIASDFLAAESAE